MKAFRGLNSLMCSFAGISESNINWRKPLLTKTSRFAQGRADYAATDVGCARVVLSKLVAREITSGACQIGIAKFLEVGADESSLLEFLCGRRNSFGHLRKSLEQGSGLSEGWIRFI